MRRVLVQAPASPLDGTAGTLALLGPWHVCLVGLLERWLSSCRSHGILLLARSGLWHLVRAMLRASSGFGAHCCARQVGALVIGAPGVESKARQSRPWRAKVRFRGWFRHASVLQVLADGSAGSVLEQKAPHLSFGVGLCIWPTVVLRRICLECFRSWLLWTKQVARFRLSD